MNPGFLLIDKPEGPTSHDIVDQLRRILDLRRIGHAGTLDPFASGLLILGIGKATRLLEYIGKLDKTYSFELILGSTSDTYDRTGNIQPETDSIPPEHLNINFIRDVLKEYTGEQKQAPPLFSAIKYQGKKLYEYARKGEKIEIQPRNVVVYSLSLLSYQYPRIFLEAHVSKGTYIRSLGHEIGKRLGTGAYVQTLRRTAIGALEVSDAVSLEEIKTGQLDGTKGWLSIGEALKDWAQFTVSETGADLLLRGGAIPENEIKPLNEARTKGPFLILDREGKILCVAVFKNKEKEGNRLVVQPKKILV
jgi:tRNA pseudouridine55 synthase